MKDGRFKEAFCAKGRMLPLLEKMPVSIVLDTKVGLLGAAALAARAAQASPHNPSTEEHEPGMTPVTEKKCIDSIRFLCIDAVEKANSGHPGICMGAAPMAFVLFSRHLRFNPKEPRWANRDRFVLSAGHGSMLVYAMLPPSRATT